MYTAEVVKKYIDAFTRDDLKYYRHIGVAAASLPHGIYHERHEEKPKDLNDLLHLLLDLNCFFTVISEEKEQLDRSVNFIMESLEKSVKKDVIVKIAEQLTKGFEEFSGTTLLGWYPRFDNEGRPINCDPNHRYIVFNHEDAVYSVVRKSWIVRIYKGSKTRIWSDDTSPYITEIDLTPYYLLSKTEA